MTNITKLALFQESANAASAAVTATSARIALNRTNSSTACGALVSVVGTDPVFIKWLTSDAGTAATTDRCFIGNSQQVVNLPAGITHAAVISTGTASTVYIQEGNGA